MRVETTFAKARALLLTRNTPLVSIANAAWHSWLDEATTESKSRIARSAPIAISDKQFAGLVWLMGGAIQAAPLSRARIVAHCAAAIRPRADVVRKACDLVLAVHGNEEGAKFEALMVDDRAEQAVMRLISGDPASVTKARVPEMVESAMRAAGEYAAKLERAKADAEKKAIEEEHKRTLSAKRSEILELETSKALEMAQVELELTNERKTTLALKMGEKAREIRELSDKISAFDLAFVLGRKTFRSTRILVTLVYGLIILLINQTLMDSPFLYVPISFAFTMAAFWYLPGALFNPICQWVALRYFSSSLQMSLGKFADRFCPDFVKSSFLEVDALRHKNDALEGELVKLRKAPAI